MPHQLPRPGSHQLPEPRHKIAGPPLRIHIDHNARRQHTPPGSINNLRSMPEPQPLKSTARHHPVENTYPATDPHHAAISPPSPKAPQETSGKSKNQNNPLSGRSVSPK